MSITFRKALCLLILGLSLSTPALAQSQTASANSPEVKELAVALERIRVAEGVGDRFQLGLALYSAGAIQARRVPPKGALENLEKSLAIFEELDAKTEQVRALTAMGTAYDNARQRPLAIKTFEKALVLAEQLGDKKLTASVFNGLAGAHVELGDFEVGLEYYERARLLSEETKDLATLHQVLNNIGRVYTSLSRYAEGLEYFHKSLKIYEELGSVDRRSLANKLQNIALIYRRQGQHDQALAYARRSLALFEEAGDKFGVANLQNNIGVIHKARASYAEALEYFQKALAGYESLNAIPGIARAWNNLGDTYRLQGRYDESLQALQKGLRIREQNDRNALALSLNNLGRLYQEQGKYAEMLEVSRRAAKISEELNDTEELWTAQDKVGRALLALGQPDEARASFLGAISTLEAMRRNVAGGEQQQQSFLENRLSPWLGMVDLLVGQGKHLEALTFAEQSKARVLLDTLQSGRANIRQSWSKEERQEDEQHRQRLTALNSKLTAEMRRDKPDAARVAELKAELQEARLEYEDFETRLHLAHPKLKAQRAEAPLIKADEIAALLPDASTAVLEYVVGEKQTYLFVATKATDVRVYTLPIKRDELVKQTEDFRQQLARRNLGFRVSSAKLYELLLKPAEAQLRGKTNLIIAPDHTLWDLPFQALMRGANRFLIEDAAIAYAPSLTVLREMRKRHNSTEIAPASLLALGNPAVGDDTLKRAAVALRDGKLEPLPEAEQEVKALGRLYGTANSKVYIGADAREDRVKSEASRARILHFATHGILNNASPMYSHLALAGGGPGEDGLLEAWELMQLDLKADLAVLSACETARGRIGAGEGMIGLSWAMFIAGVPSIVVSQWKVESAGTRDLMVDFHRSLIAPKSKQTKTQALRQAALKLMKNPATSHPFYWAGFVLVGEGE